MYVEFQSKHPHRSLWVAVFHHLENDNAEFERVKAELAKVGFVPNEFPPASPLDGVEEISFGKRGTGIFGLWADDEKKIFKREAKQALVRAGYLAAGSVPYRKLTFQDCI